MSPLRVFSLWFVPAAILLIHPTPTPAQDFSDIAAAARKARPSIAKISVSFESKSGEHWKYSPQGTAFVVTTQGHLLTAAHVINGISRDENGKLIKPPADYAPNITVYLEGTRTGYRAELLRYGIRDVALIQMINAPQTQPLPIAPSAAISEGAQVTYAGYPGGKWSFKSGAITNTSAGDGAWLLELPAGVGASGSPMLDLCGRVVGILVGTHSGQQRQQSSMLPEAEFFGLVQTLVRKESGECAHSSVGSQPCLLSGSQTRDLCMLLDTAIAYLAYHNGKFRNNLSIAIAGQYSRDGVFFNPYIKPYPKSPLNRSDRAAVAECYLSTLTSTQQKLESGSAAQFGSALARAKPSTCSR